MFRKKSPITINFIDRMEEGRRNQSTIPVLKIIYDNDVKS